MGSERIPRDEQIRLIQECQNSGMSDSQWCLQHGIRPGMQTAVQDGRLQYLLERCPSADMTDEQLEKLAPWNDDVRRACGNNARKEDLEM